MADAMLRRLREERAEAQKRMVALLERADAPSGAGAVLMSAEDRSNFDAAEARIAELTGEIERRERAAAITADLTSSVAPITGMGSAADLEHADAETRQSRIDAAYGDYLRHGMSGSASLQALAGYGSMSAESRALVAQLETRDQGAGTGSAGGFLVPQGFLVKLTERLKWYGPMRTVANVIQTASGNDMPWPQVDDTSNVGTILGENTAVSELDVVLTSKTLKSYMYTSGMVKVSWQLLNDSAFDVESYLARALGTRLGRIQNTHFTKGTGTGQPEGFLTPAAGIPAGQIYTEATGNTNKITYTGLVNLVRTLDPAYYPANPVFQMHNTTLGAVRLLVDSNGRPLWTPNYGAIAGGDPDNILGYGVKINQDMTAFASLSATTTSVAFGDWSQAYIVRDVLGVSMVRLDERFADQLQTGFFAYLRGDGRVDDKFAYAVLQTSAS